MNDTDTNVQPITEPTTQQVWRDGFGWVERPVQPVEVDGEAHEVGGAA